jgi:uncharacterized protein
VVEPLILFAHGAGAPSSHPWMEHWAERLGAFAQVVRFDYAYMREGRRSPDRLPRLIETHRAALRSARAAHSGPVVLCGKSLGGRVGCHVALEESVAAVVCLGYPLVGASARRPVRDAVLRELATRILFVQGTRDALCPLDHLERVRAEMRAPNELFVVDGGDHSLQVAKRQLRAAGEQQAAVDARACAAIRAFVERATRAG